MEIDVMAIAEVGRVSQEDIRKVSLLVCGKSSSKEDAVHLLRALGILTTPEAKPVHHVVKLGAVSTRKNRSKT